MKGRDGQENHSKHRLQIIFAWLVQQAVLQRAQTLEVLESLYGLASEQDLHFERGNDLFLTLSVARRGLIDSLQKPCANRNK